MENKIKIKMLPLNDSRNTTNVFYIRNKSKL